MSESAEVFQKPGPFGLSLPNRAVLFGAITVEDMFAITREAEESGFFDSVWVGDSVIAKPRLESMTLLSALAGRTKRMLLGPACMASFPLRQPLLLAQQWASLDMISGGRTILVACIGSRIPGAGGDFDREYAAFNIDPKTRADRLEEVIVLLRRLWTEEQVTHQGRFFEIDSINLLPKPIQKPHPPIWIASDPGLSGPSHLADRAFKRVAVFSDGWMTSIGTPEEFGLRWNRIMEHRGEAGRSTVSMHNAVHHMVNINSDRRAAYDEAKNFLDRYYETDTTPDRMEKWVSYGPAEEVAEKLDRYFQHGVKTMILRFASWSPLDQIRRAIEKVLPIIPTHFHPVETRE